MSVLNETEECYLWFTEGHDAALCVGRVIGWSRWGTNIDGQDKYVPIVTVGRWGDGAFAQVVDTDEDERHYYLSTGCGPDEEHKKSWREIQ